MKNKILFIIYTLSMGGGSERLLVSILNNIDKTNYEISVIEVVHGSSIIDTICEDVTILPYIMSEEDKRPRKQMRDLYDNPQKVFDEYIAGGYDLYVSFNYQLPSFLLMKGNKNISWIHTDVYDLALKGRERDRELQSVAFSNASKIIAISNNTKKSIEELFPETVDKIIKIENGIDIQLIRNNSNDCAEMDIINPCMIFVGRLDDNKRPDRVYEVVKGLHKKAIKIHAYFLGEGGKYKELIEYKARSEGISGYIHFLGYQNNPFPYIKCADVCCMLSDAEGFSMALSECLALDVPIVVSHVGGADELVQDEYCGRIVDSIEEAQNAVEFFLSCHDKSIINTSCRQSIERYSLSNYIKRIERLFDDELRSQ